MSYYLSQQIFIPVSPFMVYQHFAEPSHILGLHPLVTFLEIKKVEQKEGETVVYDFISREEIRMFGSLEFHVPVKGQYRCNNSLQRVEILTIARSFRIEVHVKNIFEFKQLEQGTQVVEQVWVDGPPLFWRYAGWKTKKAHGEMLQRLRTRMIHLQQKSQGIEAEEPENLLLKDKING